MFWAKVDCSGAHWIWKGATDRKGYGNFRVSKDSVNKAHIFAYVLFKGPIPKGMQVDHECNIPACVNPSCLRLLDNAANNARSSSPSAVNARKTHCIRGHALEGENLLRRKDGYRGCRTCQNLRRRASHHDSIEAQPEMAGS